jgi:hypothetical protein
MSTENLSGPQLVSTHAQEIAGCPHLNGQGEEFWEGFTPCDLSFDASRRPTAAEMEQETLNRFALAKTITDELADRLPGMARKYPPYGLPELYRDPGMDRAAWRAVPELTPKPDSDTPLEGMLTSLNNAYGSKIIIHFYDELKAMHQDPQLKDAVEALSIQRTANYHINTHTADEEAVARVIPPVENAQDTILGIFHIVSAVFEGQFGSVPSHKETVALLKNSKRLPIIPSLLGFSQLRPFIIGSTKPPHAPAKPYGYDFRPDVFAISEAKHGQSGLVMDYAGGIGSLVVQSYNLDYGDEGAALVPEVIVDPDGPTQTLEEFKQDRAILTCPSRRFIAAMWADMVDIADQSRIFELAA